MGIKKTLASLVLVGTIVLPGCGSQPSQESVDKTVEQPVKEWVQTSDNYMKVYQLLREGNFVGAQAVLRQYLREEIREGVKYRIIVDKNGKVSKIAAERIERTIDGQIDKIHNYLNK